MQRLPIADILRHHANLPVFDVRSPSEFQRGHIPGASNLPLFDDKDREIVGTIYKQKGRNAAILEGLDRVGPRMRLLIETVQNATQAQTLVLHCWRGGMRSESVGWLLSQVGYRIILVEGGYKAFRQHALSSFEQNYRFLILGGNTGSGKTGILKELRQQGQQVVDLEALAHHKGSSFGALGEEDPPTQQQFENRLAWQLQKLDLSQHIWLEDESRKIGGRSIPLPIWQRMRCSPLLVLKISIEDRTANLMNDYGRFPRQQLIEAIRRLTKRLGHQNMQQAADYVNAGQLEACCRFLLQNYYDPMYAYGISRRDPEIIHDLPQSIFDPSENARQLLKAARNL